MMTGGALSPVTPSRREIDPMVEKENMMITWYLTNHPKGTSIWAQEPEYQYAPVLIGPCLHYVEEMHSPTSYHIFNTGRSIFVQYPDGLYDPMTERLRFIADKSAGGYRLGFDAEQNQLWADFQYGTDLLNFGLNFSAVEAAPCVKSFRV